MKNCPSEERWLALMDQETEQEEKSMLRSHLITCPNCQQILSNFEEENEWVRIAFTQMEIPPLGEAFEQTTLTRLRQELAATRSNRRKRSWWMISGLAAALILGLTVTYSVSPAFANFVQTNLLSFFSSKEADRGFKEASKNGFLQQVNKTVTDKGIQLTVYEVMADPNRMTITYGIKRAKDQASLDYDFSIHKENKIYVTDEKGAVIARTHVPVFHVESKDRKDIRGVVAFSKLPEPVPNKVTVHFEFNKLGSKASERSIPVTIDQTAGHWQLSFEVDFTKAKAMMRTHKPKQGIVRSPNGDVQMKLDSINTYPSKTEIHYTSVLSQDMQQKLQQGPKENPDSFFPSDITYQQQILFNIRWYYQLKDRQGNLIVNMAPRMPVSGAQKIGGKARYQEIGGGYQKDGHVKNEFSPFQEVNHLTLSTFGYTLPQYVKQKVTIDPKQLAKKPVVLKVAGNEYTFRWVEKPVGHVEIDYKLSKDTMYDFGVWAVHDRGQVYSIHGMGSFKERQEQNGFMAGTKTDFNTLIKTGKEMPENKPLLKNLDHPVEVELVMLNKFHPVKKELPLVFK